MDIPVGKIPVASINALEVIIIHGLQQWIVREITTMMGVRDVVIIVPAVNRHILVGEYAPQDGICLIRQLGGLSLMLSAAWMLPGRC